MSDFNRFFQCRQNLSATVHQTFSLISVQNQCLSEFFSEKGECQYFAELVVKTIFTMVRKMLIMNT